MSMYEDRAVSAFADAYTALLERAPEAPSLDEITIVRVPTPQPPEHRRGGRVVWAFAAAGFVLLVVGLVGLLSRTGDPDAPPATDSPTSTTIAPTTTVTETPSTTTTVAPTTVSRSGFPSIEAVVAKVAEDHEPFGAATVEYSTGTSGVLPFGNVYQSDWGSPHGGMVKADDGYLALGWHFTASDSLLPVEHQQRVERRINTRYISMGLAWSATGMADWVAVDTNLTFEPGVRGRLFEAGGWYWIETLVPTRLYRSADARTWDVIYSSSDSTRVLGFPFVEYRFLPFGDRLLGFGSGEVIAIDMASGASTRHPLPFATTYPDGVSESGDWVGYSPAVMNDGLHVFVTGGQDTPDPDPTLLAEWITEDLRDWRGPFVPGLVHEQTRTLRIVDVPEGGFLAASGFVPGSRWALRGIGFFSEDGRDWQRFEHPLGADPQDIGVPVAALVIDDRMALVSFSISVSGRHELWVSDDGRTWQPIRRESVPSDIRNADSVTITASDGAIFLHQWHRNELHAWKVTFAGTEG